MPSPPPYVITRDYSDYQAAHQLPGPAIAGSDLDAEFNNLVVTTNALINNLGLIQRSDGALNNQSVTPDTINSALAIMIANWTIRGPWVTATVYALKDYVTNGGNGYVCIVAHTGGTFATDLAAGKWVIVATAGATGAAGATGPTGPAGATGITRPGFVNRIINGDFGIDQRNEAAAQTLTAAATVAYTVDRWYAGCSGANITGQKAIGTGQNASAYQFTGAASNTGLVFGQRIESNNISDLINQQVTVQVWLSSTTITTVTWKTFFANTTDAWGTKAASGSGTETQVDTGTIAITTTPTLYTFTTNLGSGANKGVDLEFSCGALTATNTLLFQAVQMEFGTTANPFERNDITTRLVRCQRYFEKSYSQGTAPGTAAATAGQTGRVIVTASGGFFCGVSHSVVKRAIPTITVFSPATGASGKARDISAVADVTCAASDIGHTGHGYNVSGFSASAAAALHYTANAEL